MEDVYNGIHSPVDYSDRTAIGSSVSPEDLVCQSDFNASANYQTYGNSGIINPIAGGDQVFTFSALPRILDFATGAEEVRICAAENQITSVMKSKIANHPRYPSLVEAYIDCRKVGAPPEIASLLEEIRRENGVCKTNAVISSSCSFGADPELDEFMESYFEVLVKYKSDLTHPFDEATSFLRKTERRLRNLCDGILQRNCGSADEQAAVSSDEEMSDGEIEVQDASPRCQERDLKDKLLRKYSGYLSSLKQEFSKKKKKGKLPKDARQMLLEWWNIHYKWPYPTEADKVALAECTGLDQKQINNWFINQRKRHWKPSENMQFAVMDTLSAPIFYAAEG